MRFLMVTTFFPPANFGGDGIFVDRLSRALRRQGHQAAIVHCYDSYAVMGGQTVLSPPQPDIFTLKSRWGGLAPSLVHQLGRPVSHQKTLKRIFARNWDVIHYHNISLVGGPEILKMGSALKLYTLHKYWLVCPTHLLLKYNRIPCEKPNCLVCTLSHKRPARLWRYSNKIANAVQHVDAFLAPTRFIAKAHQQRGIKQPMVRLPLFVPEKNWP